MKGRWIEARGSEEPSAELVSDSALATLLAASDAMIHDARAAFREGREADMRNAVLNLASFASAARTMVENR